MFAGSGGPRGKCLTRRKVTVLGGGADWGLVYGKNVVLSDVVLGLASNNKRYGQYRGGKQGGPSGNRECCALKARGNGVNAFSDIVTLPVSSQRGGGEGNWTSH